MKNWRDVLVSPDTPIIQVITCLDRSAAQICLVVESEGRLVGTITDGDIRRGILRSLQLSEPARLIMNPKPRVAHPDTPVDERLAVMRSMGLRHLPVVDSQGVVVGVETESELAGADELPHWVVLMVGGLGERLRPLTEATPKPLLPVGGRPLLETLLVQLAASGFRTVFLAVNYMADQFEAAFGDGSRLGLDIRYLREDTRLGTAGALAALPELPKAPLLVMNGDVLTSVNYRSLLHFHEEHRAAATMCVREYTMQVPYGVVEVDSSRVTAIQEKPKISYFISAGIYVLEPPVLGLLPQGQPCDMPTLLTRAMGEGGEVTAFPIREYWIDIGRLDDFAKANGDYEGVFRRPPE